MWGMIMIPMYRLWLHGLYGLHGPRCPLSPQRLLNLITHSLSLEIVPKDPINNIPALVQIMAWHRPGDKPLSELVMIKLSTHICITRPQWVNIMIVNNVIWARKIFFGIIDRQKIYRKQNLCSSFCPACRTTLVATRFRVAVIVRRAGLLWSQRDFEWRWSVPLFKCLTVLEFSFILFDLCLLITFFNFIMNYVPIVTFWIFTYHKIWILSIMFCSIWSYWIIYFLACLEVSWRVVS